MIERARRESNAVKVVCGIGYEIVVRVLYQAGLHGSNRKERFAMTQARFVGPRDAFSWGETRPGSASPSYVRYLYVFKICSNTSVRIMDIDLSHKIVSVAELPGTLKSSPSLVFLIRHPHQDTTIALGMSPGIPLNPCWQPAPQTSLSASTHIPRILLPHFRFIHPSLPDTPKPSAPSRGRRPGHRLRPHLLMRTSVYGNARDKTKMMKRRMENGNA